MFYVLIPLISLALFRKSREAARSYRAGNHSKLKADLLFLFMTVIVSAALLLLARQF